MNMSSVHDVANRTISSGSLPRMKSAALRASASASASPSTGREIEERLMSGQAGELVRLGDGRLRARQERRHLRDRAIAVLRVAGQGRHPQRAAPRQRRDVAHDRRGRIARRQHAREVERRPRLTSGERPAHRRRRGVGRPSRNARTRRSPRAGGPLTCSAATGARPDGAPVPSAPASESGAAADAAGDARAGQAVGAPLERGAAPDLDHQVGAEHRRPAPQVARLAELGRVVVALVGRKGDGRASTGAAVAAGPGRTDRAGRTAPRRPAAPSIPGRRDLWRPPGQQVEHGARAVGSAVEAGDHAPRGAGWPPAERPARAP